MGFRFRPTDEELLLHYLRRKVLGCPLPADVIPVADLARLRPWDLPGDGDGERYFFHLPATSCWRRGGGGSRAAGDGVWRASGKETLVVAPRCKRPVGAKRTLVFFHRGGARSDWAMHEYRLLPAATNPPPPHHMSGRTPEPSGWGGCRLFKRPTPAHRRSPPRIRAATARRRSADDMPSSPSSCVTEARENGGEEEEESSSYSAASNFP
uniref:NAC domain-containing protein n=1 Tax=Oryza brachyantha TaxID=4533 RepID=J3L7D1_ORYBR